jgi:hypothetical protein
MAIEKHDSQFLRLRNTQSSSKFETYFPEVSSIKGQVSVPLRWHGSSNETITRSKYGEISGSEYEECKCVRWDVAPYRLLEIDRRFRGVYCLHLPH